jgi:hypothetical protein
MSGYDQSFLEFYWYECDSKGCSFANNELSLGSLLVGWFMGSSSLNRYSCFERQTCIILINYECSTGGMLG